MKPDKISFNNISVKNQQIKTNKIVKNNIEFLNDKRYISNSNYILLLVKLPLSNKILKNNAKTRV